MYVGDKELICESANPQLSLTYFMFLKLLHFQRSTFGTKPFTTLILTGANLIFQETKQYQSNIFAYLCSPVTHI